MQLQRKTLGLKSVELKVSKSAKGAFTGYGAYFNNLDSDNDIILPGAFKDSLAANPDVKMFWNHDWWSIPIGRYPSLEEDEKGLVCEGQLTLGVSKAQDIHAAMEAQTIDGLSIGYSLDPDGWEYDAEKRVRILKRINLIEVSVVTFPANDEARIDLDSVKGQLDQLLTVTDYERFLREAGCMSKGLAKALTSRAKDIFRRDAGESPKHQGADEVINALKRRGDLFQTT